MIYLNEDFMGGAIRFLKQGIGIRPRAGEGILFKHSLLHEGEMVTEGTKYIARVEVAVCWSWISPGV